MNSKQRAEEFLEELEGITDEYGIELRFYGEGTFLYDRKDKKVIGELGSSFFRSGYEIAYNEE